MSAHRTVLGYARYALRERLRLSVVDEEVRYPVARIVTEVSHHS